MPRQILSDQFFILELQLILLTYGHGIPNKVISFINMKSCLIQGLTTQKFWPQRRYRWSNFHHHYITNKEKFQRNSVKLKCYQKKRRNKFPPPLTNSLIGSEHYDIKLTWYSEFTNSIRPHGGQVGDIMLHSLHTHSSRVYVL